MAADPMNVFLAVGAMMLGSACARPTTDSRPPSGEQKSTEIHVTAREIANLVGGEGGVDLEPVVADGRQMAMRLVGVSEGSTAARLGVHNGDTIEDINGVALSSVPEAYRAGALASQASRIVIRGKRDGAAYETVLVVDASR